jgi:hypothetical protein
MPEHNNNGENTVSVRPGRKLRPHLFEDGQYCLTEAEGDSMRIPLKTWSVKYGIESLSQQADDSTTRLCEVLSLDIDQRLKPRVPARTSLNIVRKETSVM